MKPVGLRWLMGALAILTLVLAACSSPQTAQNTTPKNPVVELDGYQAQIDVAKLDLAPLSLFGSKTTYCAPGHQMNYALVPVPMIGRDYTGKWVLYWDAFFMPKEWNHKLALYAHGYVDPTDPNWMQNLLSQLSATTSTTSSPDPLVVTRDLLLCQGYALGMSTYAAPGYAVQEGIADTHLLNAVFPFIFWRRPSETYVFGSSMGGLITVALAEKFPWRYTGAMPTCGPVAGSLAEFSYIGNVRLLFDKAYPPQPAANGVLLGTLTDWIPDNYDPTSPGYWATRVGTAITSAPDNFAALMNTKVEYTSGNWLPLLQTPATYGATDILSAYPLEVAGNALIHALRYHVVGAGDVMARGGGSPFQVLPGDQFEAINPLSPYGYVNPYPLPYTVADAYGPALAYYDTYYQPTGKLSIPTLSLHNPYDPDVPFAHEVQYSLLVASKGASGFLHTYAVEGPIPQDLKDQTGYTGPTTGFTGYGHCNITPTDLVAGFNALVSNDYTDLNQNSHFSKP